MRFKSNVVWAMMAREIECAVPVIDRVSREVLGRDAICTSAREGTHSDTSLHYEGRAIDLRTRDIGDAALALRYQDELAGALGDAFDVVLESNHMHIEHDP